MANVAATSGSSERRGPEHQLGDGLGRSRGLQDRDHPAHRVADQYDRLADDLGEEAVEHLDVRLHGGAALPRLAAAEPRQVEREHARVPSQQRGQQVPVEV
jgi:hypothetical protein